MKKNKAGSPLWEAGIHAPVRYKATEEGIEISTGRHWRIDNGVLSGTKIVLVSGQLNVWSSKAATLHKWAQDNDLACLDTHCEAAISIPLDDKVTDRLTSLLAALCPGS